MSHRVLPARGFDRSACPKSPIQAPGKILRFPAPNFASFAEAERYSAPVQPSGGFLLGVCCTFALEAVTALVAYGAWHFWNVLR